jgi:DNA repair photolyase
MKPPIYEPKGRAKEYGDLALNIYTGCPHRCYYCFAPNVLHKDREAFHSHVEPRLGIVEEVRKQLEKERITGKLIHLCFSCDPYPTGYDSTTTREIITLLKGHGNHVQILTKGDGSRDFDLLDGKDWYGITISSNTKMARQAEPGARNPLNRLMTLQVAKKLGIKTWVSFEPVLEPDAVIGCVVCYFDLFDKINVGKLNYHPSDINWKSFGLTIRNVLEETGVDYYIKDSLRAEMEREK